MNVLRTVILAGLLAILVAATAAAEPPSRGRLVFVSGGDGAANRREIVAVNPDGSAMKRLTRHRISGRSPRWSSSRHFVFFVRDWQTGDGTWWRSSLDGRRQQRLPAGEDAVPSPNGRAVAVVTRGGDAIDVLSAAGRRLRRLRPRLRPVETLEAPVWSPDGRWLAAEVIRGLVSSRVIVVSTSGENRARSLRAGVPIAWSPRGARLAIAIGRDLYAYDVEGRGVRRVARRTGALVVGALRDGGASWAPDGRRLAYVGTRGGIYVTRTGGSRRIARTVLRGRPGDALSVAWSSNGRLIAYTDKNGLYLVRPDGSRRVRIAVANEPSAPSWSPGGSRLTYSVGTDIFVARTDGKRTRILREIGDDSPRWSPDGSRIAFVRGTVRFGEIASPEIFVMSRAGTNARRVASGEDPAWSPDGKTIAVVRRTPEARGRLPTARIVLVEADRGRTTVLSDGEQPSWSPSGDAIAFMRFRLVRDRDGCCVVRQSELFTARPDGSNLRLLASSDGPTHYSDPTWSPDGARIALSSRYENEGSPGIALVEAATGEKTYLDASGEELGPQPTGLAWSPEGNALVFTLDGAALGVIRADGSGRTILARGENSFYSDPRWSPDGKCIAFIEQTSQGPAAARGPDVYVMSRDGTGRKRITNSRGGEASLDWSAR